MRTKAEYAQLAQDPRVRKLLDTIAWAEDADYDTLFGGGTAPSLKDHPRISRQFTNKKGKKQRSTAAGRYQFLSNTWDRLSNRLKLSDFSPQNQDIAAVALIDEEKALDDVLNGNPINAIKKLGTQWASLPSSKYPQPRRSWKDVETRLSMSGQPQAQQVSQQAGQQAGQHDVQLGIPVQQRAMAAAEAFGVPATTKQPRQIRDNEGITDTLSEIDIFKDDENNRIAKAFDEDAELKNIVPADIDGVLRELFNANKGI